MTTGNAEPASRLLFELPTEWYDDAGDGSRLSAATLIKGESWCPLFVYAFAVKWVDADGRTVEPDRGRTCQESDSEHEWVREHYAQLPAAFCQSEPWREAEIRGRAYVLFAGPMS